VAKRVGSIPTKFPRVSVLLDQIDINRKIKVEHVYYKHELDNAKRNLYKFYIVFTDEIHPWPLINAAYRLYRINHFGSHLDISPLYVVTPWKHGNVKIFYEDSQGQAFDEPIPTHFPTAITVPDKSLNFSASTWNHLFSRERIASCVVRVEALQSAFVNKQRFNARFKEFEQFYQDNREIEETISSDYPTEFFRHLREKIGIFYGGDIEAFKRDLQSKRAFTRFKFLV